MLDGFVSISTGRLVFCKSVVAKHGIVLVCAFFTGSSLTSTLVQLGCFLYLIQNLFHFEHYFIL